MTQPVGEPGFPAGLQMITRWEGQPGPGNRQTEVALVLMIQAGAWLFDVAAIVLLDEIQVVPHYVPTLPPPTTKVIARARALRRTIVVTMSTMGNFWSCCDVRKRWRQAVGAVVRG